MRGANKSSRAERREGQCWAASSSFCDVNRWVCSLRGLSLCIKRFNREEGAAHQLPKAFLSARLHADIYPDRESKALLFTSAYTLGRRWRNRKVYARSRQAPAGASYLIYRWGKEKKPFCSLWVEALPAALISSPTDSKKKKIWPICLGKRVSKKEEECCGKPFFFFVEGKTVGDYSTGRWSTCWNLSWKAEHFSSFETYSDSVITHFSDFSSKTPMEVGTFNHHKWWVISTTFFNVKYYKVLSDSG